jgi:acyl-[acyl carrier protein]--UDP-N-acetylglucosamine O-acyltransferase
LRALWVAGIGGLALGHICWLIGISAAIATSDVPPWVLVVAAVSFLAGIACVVLGRRAWQRRTPNAEVRAVFLWALPVSPVLLSLVVLGVTYL